MTTAIAIRLKRNPVRSRDRPLDHRRSATRRNRQTLGVQMRRAKLKPLLAPDLTHKRTPRLRPHTPRLLKPMVFLKTIHLRLSRRTIRISALKRITDQIQITLRNPNPAATGTHMQPRTTPIRTRRPSRRHERKNRQKHNAAEAERAREDRSQLTTLLFQRLRG